MALSPGARVGPYEIVELLGAGGMGEVYRARDPRLGREVALKVLLAAFARDAERMARFEREAQVLASLDHPNIAPLYGVEESDGVRALVMQLVEGPTLAQRIAAGPLALEEALPIARQIAEALEAAHEKGVVHRDLKPANVKVTPQGVVKVLDFGLAKALDDDRSGAEAGQSPTLSLAPTRAGVILGTAGYMSPEQVRGIPVDRRADIWSFGVVLFEMLAGKPLYGGANASDILAAVLMRDPDWSALPANTPPGLRALLGRCLERERRNRLQAIGEVRIAIDAGFAAAPAAERPAPPPAATPRRAPWIVAAAAVLAALGLAVVHFREAPPAAERVLRYALDPPEKASVQSFSVSPDGRYLAAAAAVEGKRRLWIRPLDALEFQPLPGTDDAGYPFWSPDSRYIGFFTPDKVKKIAVGGGPAQSLCDARSGRAGTWSRDNVIVFDGEGDGLFRVAAAGGVPSPAVQPEAGAHLHRPVFLPDGRRLLYLVHGSRQMGVHLATLDSGEKRKLVGEDTDAAYAPAAPGARYGHLLFVRESTLMAQPVDPSSLQATGEPFPLAEHVGAGGPGADSSFSISRDGVLVYLAGGAQGRQLAWFDRSGKRLGAAVSRAQGDFSLSPDGKRIALVRAASGGSDLWLHEIERATETRFTFHASVNYRPIWSPDGARIVFSSNRGGTYDLYVKSASGAGQEELLLKSERDKGPARVVPRRALPRLHRSG